MGEGPTRLFRLFARARIPREPRHENLMALPVARAPTVRTCPPSVRSGPAGCVACHLA
jgi:hypothetical protein